MHFVIDHGDDINEVLESYNPLAETGYIGRVAQKIVALHFGWGMQVKDQNRRIFISTGRETAKIRAVHKLNALIGDDAEKNRKNPKHHALDAICISYIREFKKAEFDSASNDIKLKTLPGLRKDIVQAALENVVPVKIRQDKIGRLYPKETIHGKKVKCIDGKTFTYLTKRVPLDSIDNKENKINRIWDEAIKKDLSQKSALYTSAGEWKEMLQAYRHPLRGCSVKKVIINIDRKTEYVEKDANGRDRIKDYVDFGKKDCATGQFKVSDSGKGQIIYYDAKNKPKVYPLYANKSLKDAKEALKQKGDKLYGEGIIFSAGCLLYVPQPFKDTAKKEHPQGYYKNRTIESAGSILLENTNGEEIKSNITNLCESNFTVADLKKFL